MKTYKGWRVERGNRVGNPVEVKAKNTKQAGEQCARAFFELGFKNVDPFTIDLEEQSSNRDYGPYSEEHRQQIAEAVKEASSQHHSEALVRVGALLFKAPFNVSEKQIRDSLRHYVPQIDHMRATRYSRPGGSVVWIFA